MRHGSRWNLWRREGIGVSAMAAWVTGAALWGGVRSAVAAEVVQLVGWIEPAGIPHDEVGSFVVRPGPEDLRVTAVLDDPDGRIHTAIPQRYAVSGEILAIRSAGDVPVFRVVSGARRPAKLHSGAICALLPGHWAGCDTGFYPSETDEPPPRLMVFGGGSLPPPDSDGDGVPDTEDDFPNDPNETTDTDGDGVGNNADPDDDGDGMTDAYEAAHGLDPLADDSDLDHDGDGVTNGDESVAGTSSSDGTSYFRATAMEFLGDDVQLTWTSVPGRTYNVLAAPSSGGPFQAVAAGIVGPAGESFASAVVPGGAAEGITFFLIEVEGP